MAKKKKKKSEVLSFLEEMIQMDLATDSELMTYEQLMTSNRVNAAGYNSTIQKMTEMWNQKF